MQRIKHLIIATIVAISLVAATSMVAQAVELDPCHIDATSTLCQDKNTDIDNVLKTVVNVLLYVIAAIALIVIIVSGIRYTASGGNSNNIQAAKNTLIYAIVGLVVAIFSWAVVNWIVWRTS